MNTDKKLSHPARSRTKIVATIGPACAAAEALAKLAEAGVSVFRINMAHADIEAAQELVQRLHKLSAQRKEALAVLVDLAGPKIRLGELPDGQIDCQPDARYTFVRGEESGGENELTANYDRLVDELSVGDTIMLADGTVSMEVEQVEDEHAVCRVIQPGTIRSRQGINLPGVRLSVPTIGEDDRQHAHWAAQAGVDFVSLSFVRSAQDVRDLRAILREHASHATVVAKIEKREALENLEDITIEADAVMVARGDLGVEIDVADMPVEQKRIIGTCRRLRRPVITATQMLDSMQRSSRPTRAEATDVANAIVDGCDACMLSGETAVGQYPVEAVKVMRRIALATEAALEVKQQPTAVTKIRGLHMITDSVVQGAGVIARQLEARLVVVASHSGATALAVSALRNFVPTVGVSDQDHTLRRMCLFWGVMPLRGMPAQDMGALMRYVDQWGTGQQMLTPGDRIVIVGGSHLARGVHDLLLVHEVEAQDEGSADDKD